jgi:DNA-binding winged helix-turn-helix (wHTH) protein
MHGSYARQHLATIPGDNGNNGAAEDFNKWYSEELQRRITRGGDKMAINASRALCVLYKLLKQHRVPDVVAHDDILQESGAVNRKEILQYCLITVFLFSK